VTQLGELMVEFPLHPGLTRALLKASSLGCQDLLLPVAAMLSVENIFIRPGQRWNLFDISEPQSRIQTLLGGKQILIYSWIQRFNLYPSTDNPTG